MEAYTSTLGLLTYLLTDFLYCSVRKRLLNPIWSLLLKPGVWACYTYTYMTKPELITGLSWPPTSRDQPDPSWGSRRLVTSLTPREARNFYATSGAKLPVFKVRKNLNLCILFCNFIHIFYISCLSFWSSSLVIGPRPRPLGGAGGRPGAPPEAPK